MSVSKDVEKAFASLDEEELSEVYLSGNFGRKFRGDCRNVLSFLNVLRKEGESGFCDVVLEVDGQSFPAHRCVLAANSQFFYTLFTSGMRDSNDKRVKMSSLSSSAVSTILDFFYTREIVLNEDNVEDLLEAASFLLLNHVKNACAEILSSNISIDNCFSAKRLAERYSLDKLKAEAESFMKEDFLTVKQLREFLDLEPSELKELISSDSLRVEKEEEVFEAIVSWVKHDPTNRAKELSLLLPCLRYGSLSPDFLEEQFEKEPIFSENSVCENILKQQKRRNRSSRSKRRTVSKERPSTEIHDCIVGVGRGNKRSFFCYDVQSEQMYKLPDLPSSCYQFGVAAIGRELYSLNRNIEAYEWDGSANLMVKHKLGSRDTLSANSWDEIEERPLKPNTCLDRSIILSLKNKLYVLGGCMKFENRSVDLQCYDPAEGQWKAMANMNTSRCRIGAIATSNYIYAIGGTKSHDTAMSVGEKTVERYNPESNKWMPMADMLYPKVNPQVVTTSGSIFVISGYPSYGQDVGYGEVYKELSNKWSIISVLPNRQSPMVSLSLNDEVYVIAEGQCWRYAIEEDLWKKSLMFRPLQNYGFRRFYFMQLKLPRFCCEKYDKTTVDDVLYNRSYYGHSSDYDYDNEGYNDDDDDDAVYDDDDNDFLRYLLLLDML